MSRLAKTKLREQALTAVVEDHRGRLLSTIRRQVRDQVEADDVFQEVIAEFVVAYDVGKAIESLGAWLVTVAQNKILDRFRRRKTQEAHRALVQAAPDTDAVLATSPDEERTRALLRTEIIHALELLPEEQREVFVMHELEGKSFEEIAVETGVGVNTLLSRKRYAVLNLREHLKEIYDELE